jgi:AcrR family transcriptional regulator
MPRPTDTRNRILSLTHEILRTEGVEGVSFDAIARKLGKTKQAVLYWFPSKPDLLAALFLPWLEAETQVACAALTTPCTRADAIGAFVRSVAGFHCTDLDRFRMMYLVPQTLGAAGTPRGAGTVLERVHPVTDRLYGTLAAALAGSPDERRREAAAIHAATLGLVLMVALADHLGDPLKHGTEALVTALVASLTAAADHT